MLSRAVHAFRKFDWPLLVAAVLLTGMGLLALYSIGLGDDGFLGFKKQLLFFVLGLGVCFLASVTFHYRWLAFVSRHIHLGMLFLLVVVLVFGQTIRGTTGWIYLGPIGFQPVEIAKVVLIVVMAKFLSTHGRFTKDFRVVLQSALAACIMILLVIFQPDLGGAIVLCAIWFVMIAVSGMQRRHLLMMFGVAVLMALVSWGFLLRPYQKERIVGFLNPASDPFGSGYNVTQSVIAIGAGQWTGRGIASGSQSQLRFLPEAPTDFIFAVIAEELGFIGAVTLLGLFGLLFSRLYFLARDCRDDFALFLVIGTATLIGVEILVNIGVATGIMPVTGLALPFVSYGGSSLIMHFFLIGLMQNIAMRR